MSKRGKELIKYIVPSVLSVISIFLCTIVDGIFVGRGVGTDALGAVNIAFPYVIFFMALVMLCVIGGMTITSIRIGRKDISGANISFMHSIYLCVLTSIVMTFIGIFATKNICYALGSNEQFIDLASDYLFYYSVFFLPCGLLMAFEAIVRTDGEPALVSIAVIVTTIVNIIGDWILIFPFKMGTKGAAIATGVSQVMGLLVVLIHFFRKKGNLRFKIYKFDFSLVKKIIVRGIPECINQFSVPITIVMMNLNLMKYIGSVGVNAFAVISYVASFATSYFTGVTEGIQPLIGKAYGARNKKDLKYFFRCGEIISFSGAIIIMVLLYLFSPTIYLLFSPDEEVIKMAVEVTFMFSIGFLAQSLNAVIASYLYSTTRTKYATIINILRSFVVNVLVLTFIPLIFGGKSIWLCFTIFESIVLIVAIILRWVADKKGVFAGVE